MISPFAFLLLLWFLLSGKRNDFGGCFLSLFLNPLFYLLFGGVDGWLGTKDVNGAEQRPGA